MLFTAASITLLLKPIRTCALSNNRYIQAEMLQRKVLGEIQNDQPLQRKVQRTYGKKKQTQVSLQNAKAIFTMPSDLEAKLGSLSISDDKENVKDQSESPIRKVKTVAKLVQKEAKEDIRTPSPRRPTQKSTRTRSKPVKPVTELSEDENIIQRFATKYADRDVLSFRSYGSTVSKKYEVKKIGEGTYSSVFSLTLKEDSQVNIDSQDEQLHQNTIIKMMPILLPSQGEHEGMTEPFYIANELQTMKIVDQVHGFIRYRGTLVVKGPWPQSFLDAFREFRAKHPKKAENEDPETAFGKTQYYALIEMDNAGIEINDIKRPSDFQIHDIFWQTAIHLANAEQVCKFEHRDLHVSNVCVKADDGDNERIDIEKEFVASMKEKPKQFLGLSNIVVTIIDYTFSRVTLPPDSGEYKLTNFREFQMEGKEYDEMVERLEADRKPAKSGDEFEETVQSLTYAKVAKIVELADDAATREGCAYDAENMHHYAPWEHHEPKTNVAWLGYLIMCLLGRAGKMAKTKYVPGSNALAKTVQDEMRKRFVDIRQTLMDETDMASPKLPKSAADVVRIGLERGWLNVAELDAFKDRLEEDS